MTEPTADDLARWAALAEAATLGPWAAATAPHPDSDQTKAEYLADTSCGDGPLWVTWAANTTGDGFDYLVTGVTGDGPTSELNAEFIAEARTALPRLLALVAAQADQIAELRAALDVAETQANNHAEDAILLERAVKRVRALCREAEIATAASRGDAPYRARVLVADVLAALDGTEATP